MALHALVGQSPPLSMLADIPRLMTAYYTERPDGSITSQRVRFGTSADDSGSWLAESDNEGHILAITQAICPYRAANAIDGPIFLAKDTHASSEPAFLTALKVLAAYDVTAVIGEDSGYTPMLALSHAILIYKRERQGGLPDGIVIKPSHNPPEGGGFKYNPPNSGPVDPTTHRHDYAGEYVNDLGAAVDLDAVRAANVSLGANPPDGAGMAYRERIAERRGLANRRAAQPCRCDLPLHVAQLGRQDPHGLLVTVCPGGADHHEDRFDLSFDCHTDHDRHGIFTRITGLLNPNHYLAAISFLYPNRPDRRQNSGAGKTLVWSGIIDRVAKGMGRRLIDMPVGFKWFADGFVDRSLRFGGSKSAGASFLRLGGSIWTTDKVGITVLARLSPELAKAHELLTERGWFAARPSGTENGYNMYAESFVGEEQ